MIAELKRRRGSSGSKGAPKGNYGHDNADKVSNVKGDDVKGD
jgi:hypothetical protein